MSSFGWRIHVGARRHRRRRVHRAHGPAAVRQARVDVRRRPADRGRGLNVVQSRVALLDIHLVFWVTLGFLLLLCDRRWIDRRTDAALADAAAARPMPTSRPPSAHADRAVPSPFLRPWRLAAGAAFGAAMAVKWSGAMAIPAAIAAHLHLGDHPAPARGSLAAATPFVARSASRRSASSLRSRIVPLVVYALDVDPVVRALRREPGRLVQPAPRHVDYHRDLRATRARPEDRHVHADARLLLEGVDVDPDAATRELLRGRPRARHPPDPRDRQPGAVLGHDVDDPLLRVGVVAQTRLDARLRRGRLRRALPAVVPRRAATVLLLRAAAHAVHGARRASTRCATSRRPTW